jgi:hypothetical protein
VGGIVSLTERRRKSRKTDGDLFECAYPIEVTINAAHEEEAGDIVMLELFNRLKGMQWDVGDWAIKAKGKAFKCELPLHTFFYGRNGIEAARTSHLEVAKRLEGLKYKVGGCKVTPAEIEHYVV